MAKIEPNTLISDRYLVVQPLSDDPANETYLAVDQSVGTAVLMKRISGVDDAYAAATEHRSKMLAATKHPVLPKVFATFRQGPDLFVVSEQIPGETLASKLAAAGKPFPASWVMFWADQLLDSLNYLHSHEPPMIHGGLSLDSIKLSDENHAVISEYGDGIANPEKEQRSDITDLSAALYELLTLQKLPSEASRLGAIAQNGADPVKRASELNPAVSVAVAEVIARGVSISPNERFNSALDMQKALRRAYSESKPGSGAASATEPNDRAKVTEVAGVPINERGSDVRATADVSEKTTDSMSLDQTVQMNVPVAEQSNIATAVISPEEATVIRANAADTEKGLVGAATATSGQLPPAGSQTATRMPPKKKSSKAGLIVGLFFGAIALAAILGLGGWFGYEYYKLNAANSARTASPTPTPTATPTSTPFVAVESSPEPSPTETDETDETDEPSGSQPSSTPGPTVSRTPSQSQPQRPDARPTPQQQRTPRSQATPAPRQTPKPKDDRTVILQ